MSDKRFYDRVGKKIGWNFSQINRRTKVENKTWSFTEIVKEYIDKNKVLLDLGTGGGEKVLELAKFCKKVVGVDNSKEMVNTANKNLTKTKLNNVGFKVADVNNLPFPNVTFDIITARHSPFNANELCRVLKSGGYFITQQIGEEDKLNIKKIFGGGQCFGQKSGTMIKKYVQELKENHFLIIKKEYYNSLEYYTNIKDIIFLLEHTPIIPSFDIKKDKEKLILLEKEYKTKKGIKTNSERFLLITRKD